jgi:hypothetical protein
MENNIYNNALLLYSIYDNQTDNGSGLKNIIAFADYVNHAIMTYEEFQNGIKYLLKKELVKEIDKKIFVENKFKEWFLNEYKNNKKTNVSKAVEKIQKYLNKLDTINNYMENDIETKITEIDFENSVNEYLDVYNNIKIK